jgi:hypothetical protein
MVGRAAKEPSEITKIMGKHYKKGSSKLVAEHKYDGERS